MKWNAPVLCSFALLAALGCAPKNLPNDRFLVEEERFYGQVRTIALGPLKAPPDLETRDRAQQIFAEELTSALRSRGFQVVGPEIPGEIWDRLINQVGGIYDPVSGRLDEERFEAVRGHFLSELAGRHDVDAVLHSQLAVVPAKFYGQIAKWCGAEQDIMGFWDAMAVGGTVSGTTGALCLRIVIEDMKGTDMYVGEGGIEVLADFQGAKLADVSHGALFKDPERNANAVELALQRIRPLGGAAAVAAPR